MKRLLEIQPDGIAEYFHCDDLTGRIVLERVQDAGPIFEQNRRLANEPGNGFSPSRELRLVAEVPENLMLLWESLFGISRHNRDHWPKIRQLCRDRDYRHVKACSGRI
jgi:hypothetical protein